jgi:hypothetical protein
MVHFLVHLLSLAFFPQATALLGDSEGDFIFPRRSAGPLSSDVPTSPPTSLRATVRGGVPGPSAEGPSLAVVSSISL